MRISAKARYGLAAVMFMAVEYNKNECVTILNLSERLKISKIYLEQVFSLLKRGGIVCSIKGAQGGYHFAREIKDISVFDILSAIENTLFEATDATVPESNQIIEKTMREEVFLPLDDAVTQTLKNISLEEISDKVKKSSGNQGYMYYL